MTDKLPATGFDFARAIRDPDFRAWLNSTGRVDGQYTYPMSPDMSIADLWQRMNDPLGPDESAGRRLIVFPDPGAEQGWRAMWVEVAG